MMLFGGVLGAELFTQRISMVLMAAGVIVYFFGTRIIDLLAVPFVVAVMGRSPKATNVPTRERGEVNPL